MSADLPRVVLVDAFGTVEDVVTGLRGMPAEVVEAKEIPAGPGIVALLVGPETGLTAAQVRALPDLRIVAATSTGYDHVPVEAVTAQGAWVTTNSGYCTEEVADHTLALILGLLRGVTFLDRSVRAGRWDVTEVAPRRIAGTTLGLVGLGRIGQAVADRAAALGIRVLAYDPSRDDEVLLRFGAVRCHDLAELLGAADVVSLHLPLTPQTDGRFDVRAFAAMRPGAFLVNVARGRLVDHAALADALRSGHLAGAALDVLPVEPPPSGDPLLDCPGLILNPHAAWYSAEALTRPYRQSGGYVADVLTGHEPAGAVARPLLGGTLSGGTR
ncbi:MAG: C-terminal binding protein [Actinomycetia bacterium]|nr:C-terminal binding protein [Actinomycetes bacterium]